MPDLADLSATAGVCGAPTIPRRAGSLVATKDVPAQGPATRRDTKANERTRQRTPQCRSELCAATRACRGARGTVVGDPAARRRGARNHSQTQRVLSRRAVLIEHRRDVVLAGQDASQVPDRVRGRRSSTEGVAVNATQRATPPALT
jgi:hypothetical protein